MKLQDVLLKAMANKISWASAAEIIGVTPRTMRRAGPAGEERLQRATRRAQGHSEHGARIRAVDNKPSAFFNGGGQHDHRGEEPDGTVRAIEAVTGQLRWEYKLRFPQTPRRRTFPVCDLRISVSSWTSPLRHYR